MRSGDADRVCKGLLVVFLEQPTCGRWVLIHRIDRLSYESKERPTNERTGKTETGRGSQNGEEDRPTEKGRKIALLKTLAAVIRVSLSLLLQTHFFTPPKTCNCQEGPLLLSVVSTTISLFSLGKKSAPLERLSAFN